MMQLQLEDSDSDQEYEDALDRSPEDEVTTTMPPATTIINKIAEGGDDKCEVVDVASDDDDEFSDTIDDKMEVVEVEEDINKPQSNNSNNNNNSHSMEHDIDTDHSDSDDSSDFDMESSESESEAPVKMQVQDEIISTDDEEDASSGVDTDNDTDDRSSSSPSSPSSMSEPTDETMTFDDSDESVPEFVKPKIEPIVVEEIVPFSPRVSQQELLDRFDQSCFVGDAEQFVNMMCCILKLPRDKFPEALQYNQILFVQINPNERLFGDLSFNLPTSREVERLFRFFCGPKTFRFHHIQNCPPIDLSPAALTTLPNSIIDQACAKLVHGALQRPQYLCIFCSTNFGFDNPRRFLVHLGEHVAHFHCHCCRKFCTYRELREHLAEKSRNSMKRENRMMMNYLKNSLIEWLDAFEQASRFGLIHDRQLFPEQHQSCIACTGLDSYYRQQFAADAKPMESDDHDDDDDNDNDDDDDDDEQQTHGALEILNHFCEHLNYFRYVCRLCYDRITWPKDRVTQHTVYTKFKHLRNCAINFPIPQTIKEHFQQHHPGKDVLNLEGIEDDDIVVDRMMEVAYFDRHLEELYPHKFILGARSVYTYKDVKKLLASRDADDEAELDPNFFNKLFEEVFFGAVAEDEEMQVDDPGITEKLNHRIQILEHAMQDEEFDEEIYDKLLQQTFELKRKLETIIQGFDEEEECPDCVCEEKDDAEFSSLHVDRSNEEKMLEEMDMVVNFEDEEGEEDKEEDEDDYEGDREVEEDSVAENEKEEDHREGEKPTRTIEMVPSRLTFEVDMRSLEEQEPELTETIIQDFVPF